MGPGLGRAQAEEVFQAAVGEAPSDVDRPPSEYSPSTPATSAGEPQGDSLAGEAGGVDEPPPPPPPDPPRGFEAGERVGVEELAGQRAKFEQDALGQILGASPDDFGKIVTMHTSEAE